MSENGARAPLNAGEYVARQRAANRTAAITKSARERARAARETCPFLTAKEAAFHLGLAVVTLKEMRRKGTGPKCRKHGRVWRYHIDDLEAWSLANAVGGCHD